MRRFIIISLMLSAMLLVLGGCAKSRVASTPEGLARLVFESMRENDVELLLTTIPTEKVFLELSEDTSEINEYLPKMRKKRSEDFEELRRQATADTVDLARATFAYIDSNYTIDEEEVQGKRVKTIDDLTFFVRYNNRLYEVRFDDCLGYSPKEGKLVWFFTDYLKWRGKVKTKEEIEAERDEARFRRADLFLVSGEYILPFGYSSNNSGGSERSSRGYNLWFSLEGAYEYIKENLPAIKNQLGLDTDDEAGYTSLSFSISKKKNVFSMYDGTKKTRIQLFQDIKEHRSRRMAPQTYMKPNPDILFVSLKDNQITLKNGFVGRIAPLQYKLPFAKGMSVEVTRRKPYVEFGEKKYRTLKRENVVFLPLSLGGVEYVCNSYEGMLAVAQKLGKKITRTEYPFLFQLHGK